jgi:signal transduction histidine kinase
MAVASDTSWVDHTHRVIESIDDLQIDVARAVVARRGYALTGDVTELATYAHATSAISDATTRLRILTADNPDQQRRLDALEPLVATYVAAWDAAIEYRRVHGFDAGHEAVEARYGANAYRDLSERAVALIGEEEGLLTTREQRTDDGLAQTTVLEIIGACFGLILITIVLMRLRREVRRRERSEATVRKSEQAIAKLNHDLERRIESRTAQLRMANDELESFSYSLIHDLRAPLRGMGSFAELLLEEHEDAFDSDAHGYLAEIQANARKMAVLIDALDAMSRIARGEINRTEFDVSAMVRAASTHFVADDSRVGANLVDVVIQQGLRADADLPLVRTLLEVLIGNSHKFVSGVARPCIEAGDATIDGERVLFVRDNGAGFDMAHYDKLFAPFGRLHTIAEFPGVGMGLAMAQRIVRRHGGRIWAEARIGHGATFYFTLGPPQHEVPV